MQAVAHSLALQLRVFEAGTERNLDTVFDTMAQQRVGPLVIGVDAFFNGQSEQLATLSLRRGIPAIYQYREFAAAGGLMSYGSSFTEMYRQVGVYTGPDSQGRKAGGVAGHAVDESRADSQPQDCEGAWPHRTHGTPRARRRGDRISDCFAAIAHSRLWHIASFRCRPAIRSLLD